MTGAAARRTGGAAGGAGSAGGASSKKEGSDGAIGGFLGVWAGLVALLCLGFRSYSGLGFRGRQEVLGGFEGLLLRVWGLGCFCFWSFGLELNLNV